MTTATVVQAPHSIFEGVLGGGKRMINLNYFYQRRLACAMPAWLFALEHALIEGIIWALRDLLTVWLWLRFTLWGYKLPPRPANDVLRKFIAEHGLFQSHNMAATFKTHTGSPINMVGMLGTPLMVFVEEPKHVEILLTDMKTYPTRGPSGFDFWVPQGLLALETGPK